LESNIVQEISVRILPLLWAITIHEVSHGWVADRLGDHTARLAGRLTLNPLKHLDMWGMLAFFLTRMIGWAKPVPVNPRNFRDPRRDMIWVALAGPGANFAMALISAAVYRALLPAMQSMGAGAERSLLYPVFLMVVWSMRINAILGIFNLVPIPPLDGGRVLVGILPERAAEGYTRIEPYGFFIVLFLLFTGILTAFIYPFYRNFLQLLVS
jgi:Zn-dependent protease